MASLPVARIRAATRRRGSRRCRIRRRASTRHRQGGERFRSVDRASDWRVEGNHSVGEHLRSRIYIRCLTRPKSSGPPNDFLTNWHLRHAGTALTFRAASQAGCDPLPGLRAVRKSAPRAKTATNADCHDMLAQCGTCQPRRFAGDRFQVPGQHPSRLRRRFRPAVFQARCRPDPACGALHRRTTR